MTVVLLVEDEPDVREMMTIWLRSKGIRVRSAANGSAALKAAHQRPRPAIILLRNTPSLTFIPGRGDGNVSTMTNMLRRTRLEFELSQSEFAALLGVAEQTYRTWDSGRRLAPRGILYRIRRLKETERGRLQPLSVLAAEFHIHVRTRASTPATTAAATQTSISDRMVCDPRSN